MLKTIALRLAIWTAPGVLVGVLGTLGVQAVKKAREEKQAQTAQQPAARAA